MIQILIAIIIEVMALLFAMSTGWLAYEAKTTSNKETLVKSKICLVLTLILSGCALGIAAK